MKREIDNLDITLGPLHYHLQAHDSWGSGLLERISGRVDCLRFSGPAHRIVHLVRQPIAPAFGESFVAGILAQELAELISEEVPLQGWQVTGNDTQHLSWHHTDTRHTFWTESCAGTCPDLPFNLPLDLLFIDIIRLGGAIFHGGLATFQGQGILLTAPPGGGKTTAFSTTPQSWQLMADDAALVWPGADGSFQISPLPTWSVLLGVNPQLERIEHWQVGSSCPLAGILFLDKAETTALIRQRPIDAAFPLYQACSEYPAVILSRIPYKATLFRTAATLARAVPAWILRLTRKDNFWTLLEQELHHGQG